MLINIEDLEARFARLRLQAGDIAGLSGLHRTTWLRAVKGEVELRGRNFRKLYEALTAEEHRLLGHLIALHPEHASSLLSRLGGRREGGGGAGVAAGIPQDPPASARAAASGEPEREGEAPLRQGFGGQAA